MPMSARPKTYRVRTAALLSALEMLVACGDDIVVDDAGGPEPYDVGTSADSEGESEGVCGNGLSMCDGDCVDLHDDDDNCGACGYACKDPGSFGHCEAGTCPSALVCIARDTSLDSCDDVCAVQGQQCDEWPPEDGRGCAGQRTMFWNTESSDGAFVDCLNRFEGYEVSGECSDPIDWQIFVDMDPFSEAVACCCTQNPGP